MPKEHTPGFMPGGWASGQNLGNLKCNVICITVVYRTVDSKGTCDSVRPVIANLAFDFQVGHLFILFIYFYFFFITASPFGC